MRSHNNLSTSPADRKQRQEGAKERQAACALLSPEQRLHALDLRLGKDRGAKKERAKLKSLLSKKSNTNRAKKGK